MPLMDPRPTRNHFQDWSLSRQLHVTMCIQGRRQAFGRGNSFGWRLVILEISDGCLHDQCYAGQLRTEGEEGSGESTAHWNLCLFSVLISL